MKTDKNSRTATTREGHLSQSELERAVPNTNQSRKYSITLCLEQTSITQVLIEATSAAEAIEKANQLDVTVSSDWQVVEERFYVDSGQQIEEVNEND